MQISNRLKIHHKITHTEVVLYANMIIKIMEISYRMILGLMQLHKKNALKRQTKSVNVTVGHPSHVRCSCCSCNAHEQTSETNLCTTEPHCINPSFIIEITLELCNSIKDLS
jgi:hypothetical protein